MRWIAGAGRPVLHPRLLLVTYATTVGLLFPRWLVVFRIRHTKGSYSVKRQDL